MIDNDIKKALHRNMYICYGCVAITMLMVIGNYLTNAKAVDESRKYLYMVRQDGAVVPMEWVDRRENIEIEVKHHLQMMVDNFYSINQFTWEEKVVNRAFWLGDLEGIHTDRVNRGYYNRFIQYNIEQKAILYPENIEVREVNGKYEFKIIINLEESYLNRASKKAIYAKGVVIVKDRNFPHNPHGLWIENYIEEQITDN